MAVPESWRRSIDGACLDIRRIFLFFFLLAVPFGCCSSFSGLAQPVETVESFPLTPRQDALPGFRLLPPSETGLVFTNWVDEWALAVNRVLEGGSGVALGDYDNDGWLDVFFSGLQGDSRLFRNEGGWRFRDVTAGAGIQFSNQVCRGAVFADVNGDRRLDLLVSTMGGGVLCFINDGGKRFENRTQTAGTGTRFGAATMALADVDGNGTLDLYVANYRTSDIKDQGQVDLQMTGGKLAVPPALQDRLLLVNGRVQEYGEPDVLYLNDGEGRFRAVSWTGGAFLDESGKPLARAPLDWGLTAAFRDLNDDGFPDLYVCNDYWTPDRIWMNDGTGRFRALGRAELRHTSASSMGVDFADADRDGRVDFFVVDMLSRDRADRLAQAPAYTAPPTRIGEIYDRPQINRNTFFRGRGDGSFEEIADLAGLAASEWSWQPVFIDVDLDGFEDLLAAAGHLWDVQDRDTNEKQGGRPRPWKRVNGMVEFQGKLMRFQQAFTIKRMQDLREYPALRKPILAFKNGGKLAFSEATEAWGLNVPGLNHGIAVGDLDNDGDLDLAVNRLNASPAVFRNESPAPRVAVELRGLAPNTAGIGAKVKLFNGAVPMQSQEVMAGGKYLSGSSTRLTFAAGLAGTPMTIEVTWRGGRVTTVSNAIADRVYVIAEPPAPPRVKPPVKAPQPLFADASQLLRHSHREEPFDDFASQPLLWRRLSQMGPGAAWVDVDGDGDDDLFVGSGKGGRPAVYRNDTGTAFALLEAPPFATPAGRDQLGVVGWPEKGGRHSVLAAESGYESNEGAGGAVAVYSPWETNTTAVISFSATHFSPGAVALADIRGLGVLDLFVAGGPSRGRYPEGGGGRIYRRRGDGWELDAENSRVLEGKEIVNSAVWSDLDQDGLPELILACEWGPVRVFQNRRGQLREATEELGLAEFTGWWMGVNTVDLDGDGRLEIAASNWGLNSPYQASPERPLTLFYHDFEDDGVLDLFETAFDPRRNILGARRPLGDFVFALADLRQRFPTHQAFARASIEEILGPAASTARRLGVKTLASTVFFWRGERFVPVELPYAAQVAPAFSVNVADFDGDGREDLFLSQNFFATGPGLPRLDAGRGLLLKGDGGGGLIPLAADESGIRVDGEQRGAAAGDFDLDGRVDLVVSQNGAAAKLFKNRMGRPGIRVRLAGPPGNPDGIGAVIRWKEGTRFGPAREVHAGSGYLSQDALGQVLNAPGEISEVWARWPGGKISTAKLADGERSITIHAPER